MRTLSYANLLRDQPRECENLVLTCMDFRFHRQLTDIIGSSGYREFDLIALPGGSKSVIEENTRETVLRSIEMAISVHKVKRVLIVDHIDCLAYGGSEAFNSPDQEAQHHTDALMQAAAVVKGRFPALEVVPVYASWERLVRLD